MKKLILFMHTTLDGFVAGPNGEMDWINVGQEIFDEAGKVTDRADTALYGRKTFEMMEGYWPTAANEPKASRHTIAHAKWYNRVTKVVISKTLQGKTIPNTKVIGENLAQEVKKLKQQPGQDVAIFGSPSACHALMQDNLIDELILAVNPVILGAGIPLIKGIKGQLKLKLVSSKVLGSAVVMSHYQQEK